MPKYDPYSPENVEQTAKKEAERRARAQTQSQPQAAADYLLGKKMEKDMPMQPKSHAPRGMGNAVKGDLGMYRGIEAGRAFPKHVKGWGRTGACAKPLTYRKPAIEGGEGPRAC